MVDWLWRLGVYKFAELTELECVFPSRVLLPLSSDVLRE